MNGEGRIAADVFLFWIANEQRSMAIKHNAIRPYFIKTGRGGLPHTCLCFGSQTSRALEQEHNTQAVLIQFKRGGEDCNRRFWFWIVNEPRPRAEQNNQHETNKTKQTKQNKHNQIKTNQINKHETNKVKHNKTQQTKQTKQITQTKQNKPRKTKQTDQTQTQQHKTTKTTQTK